MEKSRKSKRAILLILLLVVIALSIGFAAFNSQLVIKSSATVTGDESSFNVVFSTSKTASVGGTPTMDGNATDANEFTTGNTTVEGLKAAFTNPGQTATWTMYAYNAGEHDAYLNNIGIGNITGKAKSTTSQDKVDAAVEGMSIKVTIGESNYAKEYLVTSDNNTIGSHKLAKGEGEKVTITLEYASGSAKADGDFDVEIGDIELLYESAD